MRRIVTRAALLFSGMLLQAIAGCPQLEDIIPFQGYMYGTRSPLNERDSFNA